MTAYETLGNYRYTTSKGLDKPAHQHIVTTNSIARTHDDGNI